MPDYFVPIPNVRNDDRIGSVFNSLFRVIAETDAAPCQEVIWDFVNVTFLHPFFIFPLRLYKDKCGKRIILHNIPPAVRGYFNAIRFNDFFEVSGSETLAERLGSYGVKSYLPICRWQAVGNVRADQAQSLLQKIIERQAHAGKGVTTALSYLLGELIDNVEQHSESRYVYMFSQYNNAERSIDLCIADEGITIYGSYAKKRRLLAEIGEDEAKALEMANQGISTKGLPQAENRGFGLSSSKKLLVEGLGGAFFMLSGSAFHRHDINAANFVNLPAPIRWEGTIVLLRIPNCAPQNFNIYEYIS